MFAQGNVSNGKTYGLLSDGAVDLGQLHGLLLLRGVCGRHVGRL